MGENNQSEKRQMRQPGGRKRSFWKTLPGIITGLTSLLVAIAGLLAALQPIEDFIAREWHPKIVIDTNSPPPISSTTIPAPVSNPDITCRISGHVYNDDIKNTEVGIRDVKIAYVATGQTNVMEMATTDIKGYFTFTTFPLHPENFPLHLQLTYPLPRGNQSMSYEPVIPPAGNSAVCIFLSPSNIARSLLLHRTIMIPVSKIVRPAIMTVPH